MLNFFLYKKKYTCDFNGFVTTGAFLYSVLLDCKIDGVLLRLRSRLGAGNLFASLLRFVAPLSMNNKIIKKLKL